MKKIQIKFYPNLDRISKRTGNAPVLMRITKDGKKAESKLLFELEPKQIALWNYDLERVNIRGAALNAHIDKIETKFNKLIAVDYERVYSLSVKELRDEIVLGDKRKNSLFTVFLSDYITQEVHENNQLKPATKKNYDKAANICMHFLKCIQIFEQIK
ncbi:MAG: hypothetical protein DCO96_03695 [Fluviicola sp. XM-24bin1]|nr:MAG: hypothetical protein DCO96_03695 [Fluviicola sp. XM-24bin1]